jgi:hypothetical protein
LAGKIMQIEQRARNSSFVEAKKAGFGLSSYHFQKEQRRHYPHKSMDRIKLDCDSPSDPRTWLKPQYNPNDKPLSKGKIEIKSKMEAGLLRSLQ